MDAARQRWVEGTIGVCLTLAEIHAALSSAEFEQFCSMHFAALTPDDRTAALAMAQSPDRLRAVVEATEWWFLRDIYAHDWKESAAAPR
jgi:hypothetical protein